MKNGEEGRFLNILRRSSVRAVVLGHSFGSFRNSVFGKLSRKNQSNRRLNFSAGDGVALVVSSQSSCFSGNSLENVVDKVVHNNHGLSRDSSVWVNLLQNLVDV